MSTPSLLNIPYRLKAGTLYSQLPETGAGDFTVTRSASNSATRVNAAGLIETVADNVPRLDYPLGGAVNGCPALLVEPSAQNICLQSQALDVTPTWLAQNSATVNPNTAISPDGTQNADTINLAASPDSRVRQTITVANSTTYTISCFYKNIALTAGQTFRMRFNNALSAPNNFIATATIDLAAGAATYSLIGTSGTGFSGTATGRVDNYGNGWYRVSVTFTVGTGGGAAGIFEAASVDPGAVRSFYAWGAQLEVGSVATSYIPTTTGPVTRGAETISKTGVSSLIGQTEGTIYAEVDLRNAISRVGSILQLRQDGNNQLTLGITTAFGGTNTIAARVQQASLFAAGFYQPNNAAGIYKIAFAYKSTDCKLYINGTDTGVTIAPNNAFTAFSFNEIQLGMSNSANQFNDRIRAAALYPNRLSNAQLATLTAP